MHKRFGRYFSVPLVLACGVMLLHAQQDTDSSSAKPTKISADESKPKADQHEKVIQPYRLDFSVSELENGKKINSRHYAMNLTADSSDEIKIGTRVPIETAGPLGGRSDVNPSVNSQVQFQYLDVGTSIWAILRSNGDELQLEVRGEVSDIDKSPNQELAPIVRQMKITGKTLLVTGRPMMIGSMDDPNSSRQFQLEVTATKLR